ncbi:VanZ family protein [Natronomonas pharaonis DSM 2160]|uniref:VanZ family protein n=1 Tax=Natronomonas pharaonis (strain ATCC 35678 / DSM 2160 / CIP 103997 / JCM 8858 / NBRC 14720 / NCIMB 2260 / Gabara) TaxID=348780 RepID=A0A1U7EYW4_NATPD|nr:VanZ family protein [Natronomonas pharaonis]CAI50430.2 VanZ family protein [Natronomonas pharaonis DSM 2160]
MADHSPTVKLPVPLLPWSIRWLGVLAVAGLIFYSSLATVPETVIDETDPGIVPLHLWRHILAYFGLAGVLAYATDHWAIPRWRNAVLVIAAAALYGACMELGQAFLPHRSDFLLIDVAANTLGASGVVVWYALRPYLELQPMATLAARVRGWYADR